MVESRFAREQAAYDAEHPPILADNGQCEGCAPTEPPPGPRIEIYRSRWQRFIGKACATCGGAPPGWVQRQITTPQRFKRLALWVVNLVPRGVEFAGVVTSERCSDDVYADRMEVCRACPDAVRQLRHHKGLMRDKLYCGRCSCPKWSGSELANKNRHTGHVCPVGRHADSDPRRVYQLYVRGEAPAEQGVEVNDA